MFLALKDCVLNPWLPISEIRIHSDDQLCIKISVYSFEHFVASDTQNCMTGHYNFIMYVYMYDTRRVVGKQKQRGEKF